MFSDCDQFKVAGSRRVKNIRVQLDPDREYSFDFPVVRYGEERTEFAARLREPEDGCATCGFWRDSLETCKTCGEVSPDIMLLSSGLFTRSVTITDVNPSKRPLQKKILQSR